ncbi:unnamed protein product [Lactuca saligna]|uniref:F-box domain-containing protein n=1 Tax=Lactuca saligna TaxID=75948 RepID=A0AA36ED26_LACSI|nr:unnamed protein product [Lactuca saligna]
MKSRNQRKSLTDMPLEVMEKIIVDLGKISALEAFRMKSVCRYFKEAGKTNEVYKHMEADGFRFRGWSDQKHTIFNKCIEMRNPNILFRNGLMKLFFLEDDHEGKTMLEEASAWGHLDSTFSLGMMVMAKRRHRKQEALDMLNNAYHRAKVDEDHLEAIYFLGMIYISRGPHQCDEFPDNGEYTGVVDGAKELLQAVDVVHRLTTNNITFQCEDPRHSVKGEFVIGHEMFLNW